MALGLSMQIVNGEVCQSCMRFLPGTPPGFPRLCVWCGGDAERELTEDEEDALKERKQDGEKDPSESWKEGE